jgi:DNA repair exonuclease SbcCD ATPase subunit
MGKNLTEENQSSNGSGKSAIQTAIELSLTGNFSRKITKDKLVRRGCKSSTLVFEMFNPSKSETVVVKRELPIKGSEKVLVTVNGKQVELATTADANNWVTDYIGITKSDLTNYFLPNELTYTSFFDSSDTKKKEVISRFSNADIVDPVFDRVTDKVEEVTNEIVSKERKLNNLEGRLDQLREDLQAEKEVDFDAQKNSHIEVKKGHVKNCEDAIDENKRKLDVLQHSLSYIKDNVIDGRKATLNSLQRFLENYISSSKDFDREYDQIDKKAQAINAKIDKAESSEKELKSDINDIVADVNKMELVLKGKVTCPNCKYEFNPQSEYTVEQAQKEIEELNDELNEFKADVEKVKKIKETYENSKSEIYKENEEISKEEREFNKTKRRIEKVLNSVSDSIDRFVKKVNSYSTNIHDIKYDISYNEDLIVKYKQQIEEIRKSEKDTSKEESISKNIEQVKSDIFTLETEIQALNEKEETIKAWEVNFKLFKSYLANKKLRVIQDMINKYLVDMGCEDRLKLEGYKQLKNGDIREKITPYIYRNSEMCGHGEFSKGERARIDFATLLALQTLVNESTQGYGLDFLGVDEVLEGIDELGLEYLLDAFNMTKKTSMITTHVTNEQIYEHILLVEKINGVSSIKN